MSEERYRPPKRSSRGTMSALSRGGSLHGRARGRSRPRWNARAHCGRVLVWRPLEASPLPPAKMAEGGGSNPPRRFTPVREIPDPPLFKELRRSCMSMNMCGTNRWSGAQLFDSMQKQLVCPF